MKIISKLTTLFAVLVVAGLAFWGCQELNTTNFNAPDTERALSTPDDLETLIRGSMTSFWDAVTWGGMEHASTMADALSYSWGNFGSQQMSSEPRAAYPNRSDWNYVDEALEEPWNDAYAAISAASDGLAQIAGGLEIGDATRTHRATAFAKFVQGISLAMLGCYFDQAFILDENVDLATDVLELQPYQAVFDAGIAKLEEAATLMESGPAFTTENNWINGLPMSNGDLAKLTHSFIARYLAQVGRTPAERGAADWGRIRSHAERGITVDFAPLGDGGTWRHSNQWYHNDRGSTWGRIDYKHIGGADESSGYQDWLATPVQQRGDFDMVVSDLRITGMTIQNASGADVDGGTYIGNWGPSPFRIARGSYHFSKYGYYRYADHRPSGGTSAMPFFIVTENDLLIAEAMLRSGDAAGAAAIIDRTRVTNGGYPASLGASSGIGNPGDARSPLAGRSLWAMLKYEKGIECLQTGFALAYFDNRGWGDLVSGTPLHAPLPAPELEVLQMALYTHGGNQGQVAPKRNRKSDNSVH